MSVTFLQARASGTRSNTGSSATSRKTGGGKPLTSFEAVVNLIGSTRTRKGLRVKAQLDKNHDPTGVEITKADMKRLALQRDEFHGDWNYGFDPRRS